MLQEELKGSKGFALQGAQKSQKRKVIIFSAFLRAAARDAWNALVYPTPLLQHTASLPTSSRRRGNSAAL